NGNPATLYPLPPVAAAERYLKFMGGADAVVEKAQACFAEGDYRWVAEVLNHVVMAEPNHFAGRALLADTLEQLGYQSESGPWRNFYLCGALELRHGLPKGSNFGATASMAASIPMKNLFDTLAVRLNGPRADGKTLSINLAFNDIDPWHLLIENAVLHAFENRQAESAQATLRCASIDFKRLMMGLSDAPGLMQEDKLTIDGDAAILLELAGLFDQFERRFPIVTPRPAWD
ncbi:MAG: alkyl sulfatase dimerization domain-containing protein, partial [Pseudomonadales bacterium]